MDWGMLVLFLVIGAGLAVGCRWLVAALVPSDPPADNETYFDMDHEDR